MLDSVPLSALAGIVISAALVGSALLGWLADLKRVGASTSARETRKAATRGPRAQPRPQARAWTVSGARPAGSKAQEQEDRIREAYFAKERKAREERERKRRQQQARQRARQAAGGPGQHRTSAPPITSSESTYRATLELTGPVTPESLRTAYRRLIAAYHPDRCATLGVKLRRLAEEETKRINEAYAYFRRQLK